MNTVNLTGRLTRDPNISHTTNGAEPQAVARYTLAVNRRFQRENEPHADFISCLAFGKTAEFAEKYFRQGMKIEIRGRIQTGSYTNRDGVKVYTTDVVVEEQDFAESKAAAEQNRTQEPTLTNNAPQGIDQHPQMTPRQARESGEFMAIGDDVDDIGLPFN